MELKEYQESVLNHLGRYLDLLDKQYGKFKPIAEAYKEASLDPPDFAENVWEDLKNDARLPLAREKIPYSERRDGTKRPVPNVTLKIPTGGGKTLLAAAGLSQIFQKWVKRNTGFVLWIVPNDAIYSQTKKALTDREHSYRKRLDLASGNRVKILEKDSPLHKADVEGNLCVMLLMLQSANRETKEYLRIFKDRGNVHGFFPNEVDAEAHAAMLDETPNLSCYEKGGSIGGMIHDSLGNALRLVRPVVILDEGHKGFSQLARETVYGFNPCFVLELSATPSDDKKNGVYSNWLVDIRGFHLERENMIKLPINVSTRGHQDWRDTLRDAHQLLDRLQTEAETFRANQDRYLRPICLVQVERTGKEQREADFIHADDARKELINLGVPKEAIALKTAEVDELDSPENRNLLDPACQVRFIITKQALQEGWDCPFAYLLCTLTPSTNEKALTQLVGRILRQPEAQKTRVKALDECYVVCHHGDTQTTVKAIKKGLEADGMGDLALQILQEPEEGDEAGEGGEAGTIGTARPIKRRDTFRDLDIFLPEVKWVDKTGARNLDYQMDILARLDWAEADVSVLAGGLKNLQPSETIQNSRYVFKEELVAKELLERVGGEKHFVDEPFDAVYATRALTSVVPNPWVGRKLVGDLIAALEAEGMDIMEMGNRSSPIIDALKTYLVNVRNEMAEALFMQDVENGSIQFRLRTDGQNHSIPFAIENSLPVNSDGLHRSDNQPVENSLFSPMFRDSLNDYEQKVAGYLDSTEALTWWHRNASKTGYGLQGWQKHKVYPDFIFARSKYGQEKLFVLETKGNFLDNPDTDYKRELMKLCTRIFKHEAVKSIEKVELSTGEAASVVCALVMEDDWEVELGGLLAEGAD